MKKDRLESRRFLDSLRSLRLKGKLLTNNEKLLIVAVYLTLNHRPRPNSKLFINFADLAHGLFETFPDFADADKGLYLRGRIRGTTPKLNEDLVRSNLFGPKAPLKYWFEWVPRESALFVNEEGLRHAQRLLGMRTADAKRSTIISPSTAILNPTTNEFLAMRTALEPDIRLIEAIKELSFVRRPLRPLETDQPELIRTLTRRSQVAGAPKSLLKLAFDRVASLHQTEAACLSTVTAHEVAAQKISDLQRLYEACLNVLSRPAPSPRIDHKYYRPNGETAASQAIH